QQILDRLLALVDVGLRFGARLQQPCLRQREELLVVALERFGAERAERIAQPGFGVLPCAAAFGVGDAIAFEGVLKAGLSGARSQPTNERANDESDREDQQQVNDQWSPVSHACRVPGVGCWVLGAGCWVLDHVSTPTARRQTAATPRGAGAPRRGPP